MTEKVKEFDLNLNEFGLTASEQKLLEAKLNPENIEKNITELCEQINISRRTYYTIMRKTEFLKLLSQLSLELIKGRVSDILNATVGFAISNPKCGTDRKMLLEMLGTYREKMGLELTGSEGGPVEIKFNMKEPPAKSEQTKDS